MKKKIVIGILTAFLLSLFSAPVPVSAASTWYVSPEGDDDTGSGTPGSPWETIQHAVDSAETGDTIKVMDDNDADTDDYIENVTLDKTLIIERYDDTGPNPQVKAASSSSDTFLVGAGCNDSVIRGLDIYGATDSGKSAINFWSQRGVIENNRLGWESSHTNAIGVRIHEGANYVTNNTISQYTEIGIYLSSAEWCVISENTIIGPDSGTNRGIYLNASSRNTISDNTIRDNYYDLYLVGASGDNIVVGNTSEASYNSLNVNGPDNYIYANSFNGTEVIISNTYTNYWHSPGKLCYFYPSSHVNYLGNYYSDHTLTDTDGDGITDAAYDLPGPESVDSYPLAATPDNYTVQAWYFHRDTTMYQEYRGYSEYYVNLSADGGSAVWIADEATVSDAVFSNDVWTGHITLTSLNDGGTLDVEIGYSTNGIDFTASGANATITGDGSTLSFAFTTDAAQVTVPAGNYLAVRVTNNTENLRRVVTGGAWSYISNPDTGAPVYPVPELTTLILAGAGVAVLAGYILLRKRRQPVTPG